MHLKPKLFFCLSDTVIYFLSFIST